MKVITSFWYHNQEYHYSELRMRDCQKKEEDLKFVDWTGNQGKVREIDSGNQVGTLKFRISRSERKEYTHVVSISSAGYRRHPTRRRQSVIMAQSG